MATTDRAGGEGPTGQHVLIVFAHQEKTSFNSALLQKAECVLKECGHSVVVSNLYQMNFEPRATIRDFPGYPEDKAFSYNRAAEWAISNNSFAPDIVNEMEKVRRADLLIFQFPLYWGSLPAILKGWVDRIFVSGFAHHFPSNKIIEHGLLKGKKICLSFTTGCSASMFSDDGLNGDMNVSLWPLQQGLRHCGFNVLRPQVSFAPEHKNPEEREEMLENWGQRLTNIFQEDPLVFLPLSAYQPSLGYRLPPEGPEYASHQAATPGQHLGKPLPRFQNGGYV